VTSEPTSSPATEVLFYHLERQSLEQVLPSLLEKTISRGWRAVVQLGSTERLEALDLALWTFSEDSFLAHGTQKDGHSAEQPIYLTTGDDTPNGAKVRFYVDGAVASDMTGLARAIYMFDGHDDQALTLARSEWQAVKAKGLTATYWRQTAEGRWEKKA
jgi:DNA polymerase III subunit chi